MRKVLKISAYLLLVLFIVFTLLEVVLRIWTPFDFRQNDSEIILPRNRKIHFTNTSIPGISKNIIHTKNSLGFRGPEPPSDIKSIPSIIAVGGSTTECFYISDAMCWTNILASNLSKKASNVWVNNAGYQGHSTYGNFILINNYIKHLGPKYVLLMEGMNEVNRTDIKDDESVLSNSRKTSAWGWVKRNNRVINAVINIQRKMLADKLGVTDTYFNPAKMDSLKLSEDYIDSAKKKQEPLVKAYSKRLRQIIDTCLANSIQPVLITQPILYGETKDCVTGTDLSTVRITGEYNGKLFWLLVDLYNDETRRTAREKRLLLVDLAKEMPKCSKYFYDVCHFTNEGSQKVAEILTPYLLNYIK